MCCLEKQKKRWGKGKREKSGREGKVREGDCEGREGGREYHFIAGIVSMNYIESIKIFKELGSNIKKRKMRNLEKSRIMLFSVKQLNSNLGF